MYIKIFQKCTIFQKNKKLYGNELLFRNGLSNAFPDVTIQGRLFSRNVICPLVPCTAGGLAESLRIFSDGNTEVKGK